MTFKQPGQSFADVESYTEQVIERLEHKDSTFAIDYADLFPEDVIPQGERKTLIDVKGQEAIRSFVANESKFTFFSMYSSVYGEEWQVQYPRR